MSSLQADVHAVKVMLEALLKSGNHLHWIGGYVYGRTSNDDPFVVLYPAMELLKEKAVRVYEHDFKKLPPFIDTNDVPPDVGKINPDKDEVRRMGIYHECPHLFQVATYDGRDTQMGPEKRFGGVVRVSTQLRQSTEAQTQTREPIARQSPPPPPEPVPAQRQTVPGNGLPDYEKMALQTAVGPDFDYAAFMALKNGLYREQIHITSTRKMLADLGVPAESKLMFEGLRRYRDARLKGLTKGLSGVDAHGMGKTAVLDWLDAIDNAY